MINSTRALTHASLHVSDKADKHNLSKHARMIFVFSAVVLRWPETSRKLQFEVNIYNLRTNRNFPRLYLESIPKGATKRKKNNNCFSICDGDICFCVEPLIDIFILINGRAIN